MLTLIAFIIAILLLVSLHEYGHYIVARWCGVKVIRFSIGFGKPFLKKKKGDTEWCLAPIPLGGYVKMVDTREGDVSPEDLPYAFDQQHPLKKIAIVLAGPIMNLLLAIFLYFIMVFSFGVLHIKPIIGSVVPNTIAAKVGFQAEDKIMAVNGKAIVDMNDVPAEIILGLDGGKVDIEVQQKSGQNKHILIEADKYRDEVKALSRGGALGIIPDKITNVISFVEPNGPAAKAGLQAGDEIIAIDKQPMESWFAIAQLISNSPGKLLDISFKRDNVVDDKPVRLEGIEIDKEQPLIGKAGIAPGYDEAWGKNIRSYQQLGLLGSWQYAVNKTAKYSWKTLEFFGKILIGQASLSHISGPITIADIAGKTATMGLQYYLEFLALISLSLGILNLLPIPVLDGGHFVYYLCELIKGKPLSEKVQAIGVRFGLAALLALMCVAFFNDFMRLFG